MRVEAESTSSHGAAIVAFEASGLRALLPSETAVTVCVVFETLFQWWATTPPFFQTCL